MHYAISMSPADLRQFAQTAAIAVSDTVATRNWIFGNAIVPENSVGCNLLCLLYLLCLLRLCHCSCSHVLSPPGACPSAGKPTAKPMQTARLHWWRRGQLCFAHASRACETRGCPWLNHNLSRRFKTTAEEKNRRQLRSVSLGNYWKFHPEKVETIFKQRRVVYHTCCWELTVAVVFKV